jgi:hypothetical protein
MRRHAEDAAMTVAELEQRLLALEAEVQQLKARTPQPNKADPKWVLAHAGRFRDDPGFDEIARLGREYRESLRPARKKAAPKGRASPR